MIERKIPAWVSKAKEIAARVASPVGKPFLAAKKDATCRIYVYDAIGKDPWSDTGIDPQDIIAAIADAKDATALEVYINSPGGYVFDGIAIHNAIRGFKGKKTVYVDGLAASIASIIALAGDRVVTNAGAMWMIHDPAGGVMCFGTADQIEDDARKTCAALRKVRENLVDIYVTATGRSVAEVSGWMTGETWMTAAEALERGFTDEVVSGAASCECDCPECEAGNCADCSCGGCDACAAGRSCDGGECDQGGATAKKKPMPGMSATPSTASLDARLALVCAQAQSRREQHSGASPAKRPGQPGTNATPATAGKGK